MTNPNQHDAERLDAARENMNNEIDLNTVENPEIVIAGARHNAELLKRLGILPDDEEIARAAPAADDGEVVEAFDAFRKAGSTQRRGWRNTLDWLIKVTPLLPADQEHIAAAVRSFVRSQESEWSDTANVVSNLNIDAIASALAARSSTSAADAGEVVKKIMALPTNCGSAHFPIGNGNEIDYELIDVAALQSALAARSSTSAGAWVRIDAANKPKDRQFVLVGCTHPEVGDYVHEAFYRDGSFWMNSWYGDTPGGANTIFDEDATHWMPLPEPYQQEANDNAK